MTHIEYRGFTIKDDPEAYVKHQLIIYPTEEGIQHDCDVNDNGNFVYCGNCLFATSIQDAKSDIDDLIYERDAKDATIMYVPFDGKNGPKIIREDEREYFFYTSHDDKRGFEQFMEDLGFNYTGTYVSDQGRSVVFY